MEIAHMSLGLFGGQLLPLQILPAWLQTLAGVLPFSLLFSFPMEILLDRATTEMILSGLARQAAWLVVFSLIVRLAWQKGLLAYEGYGG